MWQEVLLRGRIKSQGVREKLSGERPRNIYYKTVEMVGYVPYMSIHSMYVPRYIVYKLHTISGPTDFQIWIIGETGIAIGNHW